MAKKLTQQEFLQKCKENNPTLDCTKIVYKNNKDVVYPKCKIHGGFPVKASSLLRGLKDGCPKCNRINRQELFIDKAKKIHNGKYDYSRVEYKTNKELVEIVCPIHGSFFQAPGDHLKGYGCSKCSKKYKPTTEEWIKRVKEIYGTKYDYSEVEYIDNKTPVTIICPKHGRFYPIPNNFINGKSGCPKCNNELKHDRYKKSTGQFIKDAIKVHGDKYDYSKVNYVNKETSVCIICPIHGEFWQRPNSHLHGSGCSKCTNKGQTELYNKLKEAFPDVNILYETSTEWLCPQRFDIYFLDFNIAVEYDGQQHYTPIEKFGGEIKFERTKELDKLKEEKCRNNNCKLFRLKYNYKIEDFNQLVDNIRHLIK